MNADLVANNSTKNRNTTDELASLDELAKKIRASHETTSALFKSAEEKQNEALAEARLCGSYLTEAKQICGHGKWLPWLDKKFKGKLGEQTARNYMKLANPQGLGDLSTAENRWQAYKLLGLYKDKPEPAKHAPVAAAQIASPAPRKLAPEPPVEALSKDPLQEPPDIVQMTGPAINPTDLFSRPRFLMDELLSDLERKCAVDNISIEALEAETLHRLQGFFNQQRVKQMGAAG